MERILRIYSDLNNLKNLMFEDDQLKAFKFMKKLWLEDDKALIKEIKVNNPSELRLGDPDIDKKLYDGIDKSLIV